MRIYGVDKCDRNQIWPRYIVNIHSFTSNRNKQNRFTLLALSFKIRFFNIIPIETIFPKKKNNIYPNTNNPFHFTNFTNHLPFTIEYQHALNKFPTTVYHHVKSPHFKRVTTIYILFFIKHHN